MTTAGTVEVTQADKDCMMLDALDFQVGAIARVQGYYAADWPGQVRISGIEKNRYGKLNITITDLDGTGPTDGFSVEELIVEPRPRIASQPKADEVAELVEALEWASDTLIELNPSNYDHDDVCAANAAAVEVMLGLAPLIARHKAGEA